MASDNVCTRLMHGGLLSVALLWVGWLMQVFSGVGEALMPAWLSWQLGFMVLVPAGAVGLVVTMARAFREKTCI